MKKILNNKSQSIGYTANVSFPASREEVRSKLQAFKFKNLLPEEEYSIGWVDPERPFAEEFNSIFDVPEYMILKVRMDSYVYSLEELNFLLGKEVAKWQEANNYCDTISKATVARLKEQIKKTLRAHNTPKVNFVTLIVKLPSTSAPAISDIQVYVLSTSAKDNARVVELFNLTFSTDLNEIITCMQFGDKIADSNFTAVLQHLLATDPEKNIDFTAINACQQFTDLFFMYALLQQSPAQEDFTRIILEKLEKNNIVALELLGEVTVIDLSKNKTKRKYSNLRLQDMLSEILPMVRNKNTTVIVSKLEVKLSFTGQDSFLFLTFNADKIWEVNYTALPKISAEAVQEDKVNALYLGIRNLELAHMCYSDIITGYFSIIDRINKNKNTAIWDDVSAVKEGVENKEESDSNLL